MLGHGPLSNTSNHAFLTLTEVTFCRVAAVVWRHASASVSLEAQQRAVLCLLHLSAMQHGLLVALEGAVHAATELPSRSVLFAWIAARSYWACTASSPLQA